MKQLYLTMGLLAGMLLSTTHAGAQTAPYADAQTTPKANAQRVLRIYEDDDFFNIRGKGTDEGYTNGTRIDYFYAKRHQDHLADRWLMPGAGKKSVNTYGWGLMQVMYTPTNISTRQYLPTNYPYAGALFLAHTKYAYNPRTHLGFQTELVMGVMGPVALAGPIQSWFHGVIHYQRPEGWSNQLPNDVLLNENVTVEKQILHVGRGLEWIAGASGYLGTALDGGGIYNTLRVGWMSPYFKGWWKQYQGTDRAQLYFFGTPRVEWTAYNALLEGGVFSKSLNHNDESKISGYADRVKRGVAEIDYGLVIAYRGITASYTQKTASAVLKGMGMHEVGNISFFITLH